MKKKGLIIATIVMVLVLAVSLTTATYAWFSATASTKVDSLTLDVKAKNTVAIGMHTGANNTQDDYYFGTIDLSHGDEDAATANNPVYGITNATLGLGTELTFATAQASLALETAVATAANVTKGTTPSSIDASFNPGNKIFKANSGVNPATGNAEDTYIHADSVNFANANQDYIVLKMGAQASQNNVKGIYATVKVTTTDTASTLKMMAAMHFYIKRTTYNWSEGATPVRSVASTETKSFDLFNTYTNNTTKATVTGTGANAAITLGHDGEGQSAQAKAEFSFLIGGAKSSSGTNLKSDGTEIFEFEIYAYIDGLDSHCISTATGCSAAFDIEFFGITENTTIADVPSLIFSDVATD